MPRLALVPFAVLTLLSGCSLGLTPGYHKIDGEWAYVTIDGVEGRKVHPVDGADTDSFTVLGDDRYAKDRNYVYFRGLRVHRAEPDSFTLLDFPFSRDATRVYCVTVPLDPVDADNFKILQTSPGSTTRARAWMLDREFGRLTTVPGHLEVVAGRGWATDGRRCFSGPSPLPGADPATFTALDPVYAKDRATVYYRHTPIEGADAPSFRATGYGQATDRDRRYLHGQPVPPGK